MTIIYEIFLASGARRHGDVGGRREIAETEDCASKLRRPSPPLAAHPEFELEDTPSEPDATTRHFVNGAEAAEKCGDAGVAGRRERIIAMARQYVAETARAVRR